MVWQIRTWTHRRGGTYDGKGASAQANRWNGSVYDDKPTALRMAQHIVEAGYVSMAIVEEVGK
jgi:hypothetical protein